MTVIYDNLKCIGSKNYEIGKKMEACRVMKEYTQARFAGKIGLTYQELNNYELGCKDVTVEELYLIAEGLSVNIIDLLPKPTLLRENSWYEDKNEEILYLTKIYEEIEEIGDKELKDKLYPLIRWMYVSERMIQERVRIEIARNLVKEGISVDIISQVTRLSIYEYNDYDEQRKKYDMSYKIGRKIREQRLVKRYSQEELAKKIGSTTREIYESERGYKDIIIDELYKIAEVLSVNMEFLLAEENKVLESVGEFRDQESENELIKSIFNGMHASKEKIQKAEKVRVAKNLVKAGVSVKIICKATELDDDEFDG